MLDKVSVLRLLPADFNQDGALDCADVDPLVAEIVAGTNNLMFDLTDDDLVNDADLTEWLGQAGSVNNVSGNPYLGGDANLDGAVDGSDFGIWNGNKFSATPAWCSGDFNADGSIDGSDFGIWNTNKFTAADAQMVPEPVSCVCWIWMIVGGLVRKHSGLSWESRWKIAN